MQVTYCGEIETLICCRWDYKTGAVTLENSLAVSQKVKHKVRPSNPTSNYISRRNENTVYIKTCIQMLSAPSFIRAQRGKQPKYPLTNGWINSTWCIHAMKYYLAIKRNEALIHATTKIDLENIMLSEKSRHKRPYTAWVHYMGSPEEDKVIDNK